MSHVIRHFCCTLLVLVCWQTKILLFFMTWFDSHISVCKYPFVHCLQYFNTKTLLLDILNIISSFICSWCQRNIPLVNYCKIVMFWRISLFHKSFLKQFFFRITICKLWMDKIIVHSIIIFRVTYMISMNTYQSISSSITM